MNPSEQLPGHDVTGMAKRLVAAGKGILAADESTGTIERRLNTIGLDNTVSNRRSYREMLFTADGLSNYVSGVILYDETIRQKDTDGKPFPEVLLSQGIIPGIKVDAGAHDLAGCPGEKITEGLDHLRSRLQSYYELGARFAKWRAVIQIGDALPSDTCLKANAEALARYAALCQEAGMVPIVEPEVLMDGAHNIFRCYDATERTLHAVFQALFDHKVVWEGMLLKPNMIISGTDCPEQASISDVATMTLRCFSRNVPAAVPGIVFLSGGQSEELATAHLNAINAMDTPKPWALSFSYGRALQATSLAVWNGDPENVVAAQTMLVLRARLNSAARLGAYRPEMERRLQDIAKAG